MEAQQTGRAMTDTDFLERIVAHKHEEVFRQQQKVSLARLTAQLDSAPPPRPFAAALRHTDRLGLIAEIKKQSPSKGLLDPNFDPLKLARLYMDNGADAISILTDLRFFGGSLQHLKAVRMEQQSTSPDDSAAPPLLRKDFMVDPYQVYEARAYGADAILIIVKAVEADMVGLLQQTAHDLGMDALVEVQSEDELQIAIDAGATLIGINNRDLRSFVVDTTTTERILAALPDGYHPTMVSLSGIKSAAELTHLRHLGADAILVGEAIVTAEDPAAKLRELSGRNM